MQGNCKGATVKGRAKVNSDELNARQLQKLLLAIQKTIMQHSNSLAFVCSQLNCSLNHNQFAIIYVDLLVGDPKCQFVNVAKGFSNNSFNEAKIFLLCFLSLNGFPMQSDPTVIQK